MELEIKIQINLKKKKEVKTVKIKNKCKNKKMISKMRNNKTKKGKNLLMTCSILAQTLNQTKMLQILSQNNKRNIYILIKNIQFNSNYIINSFIFLNETFN